MASTQQLKSRIRSVKSTKQITKAMQMVAASKMRRAQDATKGSAPYARAANELLSYLASQGATDGHKWFDVRPIKSRLIIVIASDKGLAGAYNANVLKEYVGLLREDDKQGVSNKTIAVGRKASAFVSRLKDTQVMGVYEDLSDYPEGAEFHAILNIAKDAFESREVDAVDVVHTRFVTSITQVSAVTRLFPAGYEAVEASEFVKDSLFEPNVQRVLDDAAYRLVGAQHIRLE